MPPKKIAADLKAADSKAADPKKDASVSYCVCCQPVSTSKDEILFCTGTCQGWIHRYCKIVSVNQRLPVYKGCRLPFPLFLLSACCQQILSQDEVTNLIIHNLRTNEVTHLKTVLSDTLAASLATSSNRPSA